MELTSGRERERRDTCNATSAPLRPQQARAGLRTREILIVRRAILMDFPQADSVDFVSRRRLDRWDSTSGWEEEPGRGGMPRARARHPERVPSPARGGKTFSARLRVGKVVDGVFPAMYLKQRKDICFQLPPAFPRRVCRGGADSLTSAASARRQTTL